jgi:DNA replication and repair protein RecF
LFLKRLDIAQVRNLQPVSLHNFSRINLIDGSNGSGKTSMLESIHLLALGRSFRSNKIQPLIHQGYDQCSVYGQLDNDEGGSLTLGVVRDKTDRPRIKLNGEMINSFAQLADTLPLLVLNADTFLLIEGGPGERRRYLDWGVFHVEHDFYPCWQAVQRALQQRNALLRSDRIDRDQLRFWDEILATQGERLQEIRQSYFLPLIQQVASTLAELTEALKDIEIRLVRGWPEDVSLQDQLAKELEGDRRQGFTRNGPHRAELKILHKGRPAAEALSRGQTKLLATAMRLAQGALLRERKNRHCLILLDDLPAELDANHRQRLCRWLEESGHQVFITCVDQQELHGVWRDSTALSMFHVEHGQINPLQKLNK